MSKPTGPACGNNPNYPITDGDRKAVADFRAYLAEREQAATTEAEAALAPLEAKARKLREQQDAKLRAEELRQAANAAEGDRAYFDVYGPRVAAWLRHRARRITEEA